MNFTLPDLNNFNFEDVNNYLKGNLLLIKKTIELFFIALILYIFVKYIFLIFSGSSIENGVNKNFVKGLLPIEDSLKENKFLFLTSHDAFKVNSTNSTSSFDNKKVSEIPTTDLELKLFGVRSNIDHTRGMAIIQIPNQGQKNFLVGDEIISGVKLQEIYPDKVIILRSGVAESLALFDTKKKLITPYTEMHTKNNFSDDNRLEAEENPKRIIDFKKILDGIKMTPRIQGGRINGFTMQFDTKIPQIQSAGILSGDIVLAINGVRLVSIERIKDAQEELNGLSLIQIEIERDGRTLTKNINLN